MTWNTKRFLKTNKEVVVLLLLLTIVFLIQKKAGFNPECLIPAYCAFVSPEATTAKSNITNAVTKLNETMNQTLTSNTTRTEASVATNQTMDVNFTRANFIGCAAFEATQMVGGKISIIQKVKDVQATQISSDAQDAVQTFIEDVNETNNGFAATGNLSDLLSSDSNTETNITNTTELTNKVTNITSMDNLNEVILSVSMNQNLYYDGTDVNFICGKDAAGNALSPAKLTQEINIDLVSQQITSSLAEAVAEFSNSTEISNKITKAVEESNSGVEDVIDSAGDAIAKNNPFAIMGQGLIIVAVVAVLGIVVYMMNKKKKFPMI